MLDLDSDRWAGLDHAYGGARDVPQMLRDLAVDPSDEVWERLWSSLCHQGDVYPASYAAVPHIVRIAQELPLHEQTMYWAFVGSIARGSCKQGRQPDEELKPDFDAAQRRAAPIILQILKEHPGDETTTLHLLQALVAVRRRGDLVDVLEGLRDEELNTWCPDCKAQLFVHVQDEHVYVSTQRPGGHPDPDRTFIECSAAVDPGPDIRLEEIGADSGAVWLPRLAAQAGEAALATRLSALYGKASCPVCGRAFVVMDHPTGTGL